MSQEINEPVDAVIEFISSHSSSRHGQREEGASGPGICYVTFILIQQTVCTV